MLLVPNLHAQDAAVQYEAIPLGDHLTMLIGRGGNVAISAGDEGVYLIDDQFPNIADQLLAQVRKISDKPIRFVINTHYHGDHTGGNEALGGQGAIVIAHDNIRQRMSTEQFNQFWNGTTPAATPAALPVITFNDSVTLHLNGEATTVIHVPRGHTDGDSIVHFTGSNVIHMGDNYFQDRYPYIDLDGGGTLQGMITAIDKALALSDESTRIIPGHGKLSNPVELKAHRDLLQKASDNVQALVDQGKTLDEAIAAKPTAEWDDTLGAVWITPAQFVTFIYNSLTGVDHFTRTEANTSK
ncbi:MAG TPA: MBL fold metallo-hydrolase [Xanthomonadales bacterium]|nr:MBL fold metallo-hydrolase [Xanthomonadales bacterium]